MKEYRAHTARINIHPDIYAKEKFGVYGKDFISSHNVCAITLEDLELLGFTQDEYTKGIELGCLLQLIAEKHHKFKITREIDKITFLLRRDWEVITMQDFETGEVTQMLRGRFGWVVHFKEEENETL